MTHKHREAKSIGSQSPLLPPEFRIRRIYGIFGIYGILKNIQNIHKCMKWRGMFYVLQNSTSCDI